MTMHFDDVYPLFRDEIRRLSHTQWVPDLDPDDVQNEMLITLWKACDSFSADKGTFGSYWWSLWRNRRRDLCKSYYALKRVKAIPMDVLPDVPEELVKIVVPPTKDALGTYVWGQISDGATPKEVTETVGISRRRYYNLISEWRTPSVYVHIVDG